MWGMRTATPEYRRAVLGAFAFATIWSIDAVTIVVDDVDHASVYRSYVGGMNTTPLLVTVRTPYGRPDPRGPDSNESAHLVFAKDATGRTVTVRQRPPAQVGAVVPLDLTAAELEHHALAARARLDRELERGYGVLHTVPPPPDHHAAERKLLPERASACHGCPYRTGCTRCPRLDPPLVVALDVASDFDPEHTDFAALDVVPVAEPEEVDGELVTDDDRGIGKDARPFWQTAQTEPPPLTREDLERAFLRLRGEPIRVPTEPSFADRIEREIRGNAIRRDTALPGLDG